MSSTAYAYAVMGVRLPMSRLFTAGECFMHCRRHGVSEGKGSFCAHCGDKLNQKWEQIPTPAMEKAALFYTLKPLALWQLMQEKRDDDDRGLAPLGFWRTSYANWDSDELNDDDDVVVGLRLMETPFHGNDEYPIADRSTEFVYETGNIASPHLRNFGIEDKPRIFVFSYFS